MKTVVSLDTGDVIEVNTPRGYCTQLKLREGEEVELTAYELAALILALSAAHRLMERHSS